MLGCTEFPVLLNCAKQSAIKTEIEKEYVFWDPMEIILEELKKQLI